MNKLKVNDRSPERRLGVEFGNICWTEGKDKTRDFELEKEPTRETHPKYDIIYGPFKTVKDAENYVKAMDRGVACGEG